MTHETPLQMRLPEDNQDSLPESGSPETDPVCLQRPHCVLIVDDDPIFCSIAETYFNGLGASQVILAADGAVGTSLFLQSEQSIDFILLDLNMPHVDGVEVLQFLNQRAFKAPILIVSGAEENLVFAANALAKAYSLNIVGALSKPLDTAVLDNLFSPASAN